MPRFLISIHHPDAIDATLVQDPSMDQAIDDLNDEMVAAGVRVFVGGLHHASRAVSIGTDQTASAGPYLKTDEHVGGFWVVEAVDLDEAVEWGKKAAAACRVPVEVRQFH